MSHLLEDFKHFLDHAPTAYHAAQEIGNRLATIDFTPLEIGEKWILEMGKKYFLQRDGFLCAFTVPKTLPKKILLLASHTDSPTLKLKPHPVLTQDHLTLLTTEIYGSPLINSWFNRDLALAGKVIFHNAQGVLDEALVWLDEAPLFIPDLAPHLGKDYTLDKQEHLRALFTLSDQKNLLEDLLKKQLSAHAILSFDLCLTPLEKARFVGLHGEMISSYRLDNLSSAHACCTALANAPSTDALQMALFCDHEEIGSSSSDGADSSTFSDILKRITCALSLPEEEFIRLKTFSLCVSVDVAHAFNPNFASKYDPEHKCFLGKGITLKYNAHKKYATDAKTAAHILQACKQENIPCQSFTSHSALSCGSTLGPILAQTLGIPTVDIGAPLLSMHALREVIAVQDHLDMCKLLTRLLSP